MSQSPALPGQRLFNAANGIELKEIVLNQIKNEMTGNRHLKRHLTYPRFKFKWTLEIEAYPLDPPNFEMGTEGEVVAQVAEESDTDGKNRTPYEVKEGESPVGMKFSGEMNPDANLRTGEGITTPPDKAREDAGLQVPTVTTGKRGETIERPTEPPPPRKFVPQPREEKATSPTRSVEIDKNNPKGQDRGGG